MMAKALPAEIGLLKAVFGDGGRVKRYPWVAWADGRVWHLVRGQDYECTNNTLIDAAAKYARRHGLRLQRRQTADGLYLRFTPKESHEPHTYTGDRPDLEPGQPRWPDAETVGAALDHPDRAE